ncbi:hypothetical protein ACIO02_22755 [Streptomyces sp. NPDC087568]|uniref:hypothetical protein n=1 Tax=Streptomyces sp. NPDC087568 TaxID=3365799 RepID=UPI00382C8567
MTATVGNYVTLEQPEVGNCVTVDTFDVDEHEAQIVLSAQAEVSRRRRPLRRP